MTSINLTDVANTTRIAAVFALGQYHNRAALNALANQARRAATASLR